MSATIATQIKKPKEVESEAWTTFLRSCSTISEDENVSISMFIPPSRFQSDSVRRFQHSDTLLKSFLVVNPQDLYLVRIPKQSHVVKLTKATLPDFVHDFLKEAKEYLKQKQYEDSIFAMYQLSLVLLTPVLSPSVFKCVIEALLEYQSFLFSLEAFSSDGASSSEYTSSSGDHSSSNTLSFSSPPTDASLHTSLLQPSPESPSALIRRLWQSTHFLHYLLPRFLLQFTLLPLLHRHDPLSLQHFLSRLPQHLTAVSPPDTLLFALVSLLHSLAACLPATSPLANPLAFLNGEKTLTELLASRLPPTPAAIANFACELLGDWLQLPGLGVCRPRGKQTLLCFHYLVSCTFPFADAQIIAKTLLRASLSGIDLMIMEVCVRGLSRDFFSTHYKEVLRFVSKSVQAPLASLAEKTHAESLSFGERSRTRSSDFSEQFIGPAGNHFRQFSHSSHPSSDTSRGETAPEIRPLQVQEYESKKTLFLTLLRHLRDLPTMELDVSLLNTLWKLLGTFYNRDYFVFVGELLPFVARHYSRREVLIVLEDVVEHSKMAGISQKQGQLEGVLSTLLECVDDISAYLESDVFLEFLDCGHGESHLTMCIRVVNEVLAGNPRIENPAVIDDLFHVCESGANAYSELISRDSREAFHACIRNLLECVSFGDNFEAAFDFFNACLRSFSCDATLPATFLCHLLQVAETAVSSRESSCEPSEPLDVRSYQLVTETLSILATRLPAVPTPSAWLLGERSLALALRGGSLAQSERILNLVLHRGEESGWVLGRILGCLVEYPCLPFRGEGEVADVFVSVGEVQGVALRGVGRGVEMYTVLVECVVAMRGMVENARRARSMGLQADYDYFDFASEAVKDEIYDITMASVEAIFGDVRKRLQRRMETEETAAMETFLFMMMDVFLELFESNEVLQHIICTCAQFLSELNTVMPLSEENQQHLNEIKRSDYRRPS
ncbi:hypothetical protein WA538_004729, partial [Blastocystis sp. DL]